MTERADQFDLNDEASQLAMVEGLLSVERTRELRDRLANGTPDQRALLERLDGMRRDRAALASLVVPAVPTGMVEAAMRRAQREALAGLQLAGERTVEIPVSRVVPTRTIWWTGTRRLAAAAAIVGLVGGVGLISIWPKSPKGDQTASRTGTNDESSGITAGPTDPATDVAIGDPADPAAGNLPDVLNTETPTAPTGPLVLAAAPAPDRTERMLELAKTGRLVIRVAPRSPRQCEQQLASLASRPQGSRVWNVSTTPPAQVVASLAALTPRSTESREVLPTDAMPAYAGTSDRRFPMIVRLPAPLAIALPPKAEDLIGLVRVAPTLDGIESVRRTLAETLGEVTVSELDEPLAGIEATVPARTLDSTLWWSGPPTQWAPWASVPVIIER